MEIDTSNQQGSLNVRLSGQFTFNDNQIFRSILEMAGEEGTRSITLDFTHIDFIDSAGLGMLLLLRDRCSELQRHITLAHPHGHVEKIFTLSKFDQLFSIVR